MKKPNWLKSKKQKSEQIEAEEKRLSIEERVKRDHPAKWKKPPVPREQIIEQNFQRTIVPVARNMAIAMDESETSQQPQSFAMDAVASNFSLANSDIPDKVLEFFGQHSFIGYQSCAILSQHWIIESACTTPPNDAMAPDFVLSYSDNNKTDAEKSADGSDEEELMDIKNAACEEYNISALCRKFSSNKKTFGVALAVPVMADGVDMSLPYNADGITKGQYKGMAIVEPYWVMPQLDSSAASDPASLNFYEPTWYNVRGKQIHYTWVVKIVNTTLPDILKPTYYYGGVPLPQMIYERVYAAEKTANEAPLLALTKRMLIADADVDNLLANPEAAQEILQAVCYMRDNHGVWFKRPDDQVSQIDTSLTEFDALIMTQFQLVASIAGMPATKLLKTTPKGFNATGDYEWKDYAQSLVAIQEHDFIPMIKRHLELYCRSELGKDIPLTVTFNPVDVPTEKEVAEVEEVYSRVYTNYTNGGVIDAEEVREILRNDEGGRFSTLSEDAPDMDIDAEAEELADKVEGEEQTAEDAAEFKESEHPRDSDGKFGIGGGSSNSTSGSNASSVHISKSSNLKSIDIEKARVEQRPNFRGHYEKSLVIPAEKWVNKKMDKKSFEKNTPENIRNAEEKGGMIHYQRLSKTEITPKEYERSTGEKFKYSESTFFFGTKATFKTAEKPEREPDYESASGSKYWYSKEGVIRHSDHWGNVASTLWQPPKGDTGFVKWEDFETK